MKTERMIFDPFQLISEESRNFMKRKRISILPEQFPLEMAPFFEESIVYDSSCSSEAKVYYIEKDDGFFLKVADGGILETEASMTAYMNKKGLGAEVLAYCSEKGKDYLLTRRVPGEDCTHPDYLSKPEHICDITASLLRELHETQPEDCPIQDRNKTYVAAVIRGFDRKHFESDLFQGMWEFSSFEEAKREAEQGIPYLKREVLLHGDYCLPNVILDDWHFSGFIDVGNGGIGDRHIDILWGIWTLRYNLKTDKYTQRFIDAYGRELINPDKLRSLAAMEMTGG